MTTTRELYREAYRVKRYINRQLDRADRIEKVANMIVINRRSSKSSQRTRRIKKYELIARANTLYRSAADLEKQFNRYPKPIRKAAQASYTAARKGVF